jgi:sporulation protein YlmC with PRC-barrel domain
MAHYGSLRNMSVTEPAEDIRGSHVYGINDEKLGKIDDVIFDHMSGNIQYVVVDTGGWLSSKKFIVPADRLRSSAKHEDDYETNLTKDQVQSFPAYNESDLQSEDKWSNYEGRYRAKWVADPVMHRAETDRNVTPTSYQASGNVNSEASAAAAHGRPIPTRTGAVPIRGSEEADLRAADATTERAVPAGTDAVVISTSANGIGGRWDTFQSRLRERRKEATAQCGLCSAESSATKRGVESTDKLRKAV